MHVGQAKVPAGVPIRQSRMVEAQQVQHCGMQIVYVDGIVCRLKSEFVGRSVNRSTADTAARQPARETIVIVVASI